MYPLLYDVSFFSPVSALFFSPVDCRHCNPPSLFFSTLRTLPSCTREGGTCFFLECHYRRAEHMWNRGDPGRVQSKLS